jgi:hypothetical protein
VETEELHAVQWLGDPDFPNCQLVGEIAHRPGATYPAFSWKRTRMRHWIVGRTVWLANGEIARRPGVTDPAFFGKRTRMEDLLAEWATWLANCKISPPSGGGQFHFPLGEKLIPFSNQADTFVSFVALQFDVLKYSLIAAHSLSRSQLDCFLESDTRTHKIGRVQFLDHGWSTGEKGQRRKRFGCGRPIQRLPVSSDSFSIGKRWDRPPPFRLSS